MTAPTIEGVVCSGSCRRPPGARHRLAAGGRRWGIGLLLGLALVGTALNVGCAAAKRGEAMVDDGASNAPRQASRDKGAASADGRRRITRAELQQRLMAFADRYLSRISEATDYLKANAATPAARMSAHATKYYPATTVLTIAAAPDPEAGLLDMLTVVTLERMVWHDTGWAGEVFGAAGAGVLRKAQVEAEQDIWACAAAVLSPERVRDVRQLIEDWRRANPGHRYVSTMRFDDFAAGRGELPDRAAKLARGGGGGGFLAPINEATRAVDESRVLGERFMFLTARLPRVMSWQAELFVYDLAGMSEMREALANNKSMALSMQRFATSVEGWPAVIAREREALLKDFAGQTVALERLVKEARAALAEAQPVAADVRRTSESAAVVAAELRGAVREAGPLMEQVARLSGKGALGAPVAAAGAPVGSGVAIAPPPATNINGAVDDGGAKLASEVIGPTGAVEVSGAPVPPGVSTGTKTPAGRPFDIQEYQAAIRELRELIQSSESLLASRAWQARLNDVNNAADTSVARASREGRAMIDYGFYRGVFFALFCAAVLFGTALLYRFTARRLFPPMHPHGAAVAAGPAGTAQAPATPPEARPRHRLG